jgi:hypothetical protein
VAEYAVTGRSRCKKCQSTIPVGAVRFRRTISVGGRSMDILLDVQHGMDAVSRVRCSTGQPSLVVGALRHEDRARLRAQFERALSQRRCK